VRGIERDVHAAGLEDREHRDEHVERGREAHRDLGLGRDAALDQQLGKAGRAVCERTILDGLVAPRGRDCSGAQAGVALEAQMKRFIRAGVAVRVYLLQVARAGRLSQGRRCGLPRSGKERAARDRKLRLALLKRVFCVDHHGQAPLQPRIQP
jgi:hypothetical protein